VLANSGVPADLRDQATVALMWAWLGLRGNQQADQLAGTILAELSTEGGELVWPRWSRSRWPGGTRAVVGLEERVVDALSLKPREQEMAEGVRADRGGAFR
jgi:hypothetical protein